MIPFTRSVILVKACLTFFENLGHTSMYQFFCFKLVSFFSFFFATVNVPSVSLLHWP